MNPKDLFFNQGLSRLHAFRQRLEISSASLERKPVLLLSLMTAFYVSLVLLSVRKNLWFDELFTYYIAKQSTISQLLSANYYTDLNPPLLYLLVRWCHHVFGDNEVATRLPTVVGFWIGSVAFFFLLGKRAGYLVSGGAIATLWSGFFFIYAVEARPYGLWLGFFGSALYCWDVYPGSRHPRLVLVGLLFSNVALMLTHVLAPFSIIVICAGECVRSVRARRVGWLWMVLLPPMGIEVGYLYWMRQFEKVLFPSIFQASLARMIRFYGRLAFDVRIPLVAGTLVAGVLTRWGTRLRWAYRFSDTDGAIGLAMFLLPYGMIAALARSHGAFHFRYGIIGSLVLWTLYSVLLNYLLRNQPLPAAAFIFVSLAAALVNGIIGHIGYPFIPQVHPILSKLKPELPLVAASGLTFLELDHYESSAATSRLFYLTDREYAIKYAHDTLFEGYQGLKPYFPIRGRIERYRDFIAQHPHFLVFGDRYYLEDWLLKRLADDPHFAMKVVGKVNCCYKDREIFEITNVGIIGR